MVTVGRDASGRLTLAGVSYDENIWRDERVSDVLVHSPPVDPILVDKTYVYELR